MWTSAQWTTTGFRNWAPDLCLRGTGEYFSGELASMRKTKDTDIRASPKEQPGNHPSEANSPPVSPTPTPKHPEPRVSSLFFMVPLLHRTLSLQGIRTWGKHLIQKSRRHDQQAKKVVQKLLQGEKKNKTSEMRKAVFTHSWIKDRVLRKYWIQRLEDEVTRSSSEWKRFTAEWKTSSKPGLTGCPS